MTNNKAKLDAGWQLDNSYARLPERFFSRLMPAGSREPKLVLFNTELADFLGLHAEALQSEAGVAELAGNAIPEGAEPLAQAYAGHQFGYFNMLGDGRALLLGEQITPSGERMDIQLKGSGHTPYSRQGDGKAALGPMLREYIMSEAMHALGIPTTRSLAVVTTGQPVIRETELQGAVLTRVAASHIRVGTFQYAANFATADELRALADYTIRRHFPELAGEVRNSSGFDGGAPDNKDSAAMKQAEPVQAGAGQASAEQDVSGQAGNASGERYLLFLEKVIERQAALIAKWQLTGFIHGVMNTDNMSICGETIDYGPCAFMDTYNPATVFSSIDSQGRYAYGNQPRIGVWNLARLAETLLPLIHDEQEIAVAQAEELLSLYAEQYHKNWLAGMRSKLGMATVEQDDESIIEQLLGLMQKYKADYTNTFRSLTLNRLEAAPLFESEEFAEWHALWLERLKREPSGQAGIEQLMKASNPAVIPRNHRVEEALEAAEQSGDYSKLMKLLEVLADPYAYTAEQEAYAALPEPADRPYRTYCGT